MRMHMHLRTYDACAHAPSPAQISSASEDQLAEAEQLMQKFNWAKEVLLGKDKEKKEPAAAQPSGRSRAAPSKGRGKARRRDSK